MKSDIENLPNFIPSNSMNLKECYASFEVIAEFLDYYDKLQPNQKCTVHPPAGSGGSTGLFNLPKINIFDKFIAKTYMEDYKRLKQDISKGISTIESSYNRAVKNYVDKFCKKNDLDFEYWVSDEPGTICEISGMFVEFQDIKYDIDSNQPSGRFQKFYEDIIEFCVDKPAINYKHYCLNLRPQEVIDAENEASKEKSRQDVEFAKSELEKAIAEQSKQTPLDVVYESGETLGEMK